MNEEIKQSKRVFVLVDGFNLYHSIADKPDGKRYKNAKDLRMYKWLNLRKLAESFILKDEEIVKILYFSAYSFWKPDRVKRHKTYVQALRTVGVTPIISDFKERTIKCKICQKLFKRYEEKQTDVHIAINLFKEGINDSYDKIIIISGDSDLIPAIEAVKEKFPQKSIHILFPPLRAFELLKNVADSYSKIKEHHLLISQFPDVIELSGGDKIIKPEKWRK